MRSETWLTKAAAWAAIIGILVAIVAIIVPVIQPEIRRFLGLDTPLPKISTTTPSASPAGILATPTCADCSKITPDSASLGSIALQRTPDTIVIYTIQPGNLSDFVIQIGLYQNEAYSLGKIFASSNHASAGQIWCLQANRDYLSEISSKCDNKNTYIVQKGSLDWRNLSVFVKLNGITLITCEAQPKLHTLYDCPLQ